MYLSRVTYDAAPATIVSSPVLTLTHSCVPCAADLAHVHLHGHSRHHGVRFALMMP